MSLPLILTCNQADSLNSPLLLVLILPSGYLSLPKSQSLWLLIIKHHVYPSPFINLCGIRFNNTSTKQKKLCARHMGDMWSFIVHHLKSKKLFEVLFAYVCSK